MGDCDLSDTFGSAVSGQRLSRLSRRAFCLGAPALVLTACSSQPVIYDSDDLVRSVRYQHPGPKYVTVLTMFNVSSDNGAHTALIINASERVIFDPAGNFRHSKIPEQHDVLYGITPRALKGFIDCHARATFYAKLQTVEISAQSAERAFRHVQQLGHQNDAACTTTVSGTLALLPEFQGHVRQVFFPNKLHDMMQRVPGVVEQEVRQDDDPDKHTCIAGLKL